MVVVRLLSVEGGEKMIDQLGLEMKTRKLTIALKKHQDVKEVSKNPLKFQYDKQQFQDIEESVKS